MKARSFFIAILSMAILPLFSSCGGEQTNENTENSVIDQSERTEQTETEETTETVAVYQCPMKCEGDKTYAEAGQCPVCKMDLALVEESDETMEEAPEEHDHSDPNHSH